MPEINPASIADTIAADGKQIIEFWKANYTPDHLRKLDELCRLHGPKLGVRFYGHYGEVFDANVLQWLPSVQNLSIDCLDEIINSGQIGRLSKLRRLSFGVTKFDDPDFLQTLDLSQIESLTLSKTATPLDLRPLTQAQRLQRLYIDGHHRHIECLISLPMLGQLTLSSMPSAQSLAFIANVKPLRVLRIYLGGRENLNDFSHDALEFLEVVRVRGLSDLGPLRRFSSLAGLVVRDQIKLGRIDLQGASLKFLALYNCKSLTEVSGLDAQDALIELTVSGTALHLDDFPDCQWPPSLRTLRLFSKSKRWNEAMKARLDVKGYSHETQRWHKYDVD